MNSEQIFAVSGHVAVVTGAASGLGLAMTEVMAANGAHVRMLDINEQTLDAQVKRLRAEGCSVEGEVVDVGDPARLTEAIDTTARRHGRLDVLFANAGIPTVPGYTTEAGKVSGQIQNITFDQWNRALNVNLTGVFVSIKAAAPHMKARRYGRIVVTSSRAALRAESISGHPYAATKAAIAHLVRTTARELAPHNVLVNAIAPGPFETNISGAQQAKQDPAFAQKFTAMVPLGRFAQPDEIKGLALFLASPASSFVTGAIIPIDGASST